MTEESLRGRSTDEEREGRSRDAAAASASQTLVCLDRPLVERALSARDKHELFYDHALLALSLNPDLCSPPEVRLKPCLRCSSQLAVYGSAEDHETHIANAKKPFQL